MVVIKSPENIMGRYTSLVSDQLFKVRNNYNIELFHKYRPQAFNKPVANILFACNISREDI